VSFLHWVDGWMVPNDEMEDEDCQRSHPIQLCLTWVLFISRQSGDTSKEKLEDSIAYSNEQLHLCSLIEFKGIFDGVFSHWAVG